jgi:hypothetical protein
MMYIHVCLTVLYVREGKGEQKGRRKRGRERGEEREKYIIRE